METRTKKVTPVTKTGRIRFSVMTSGNLIGEQRTAFTPHEMVEKLPKRVSRRGWVASWRNNHGQTVSICSEFMEDMTIDEIIEDWLAYASFEEREEPVTCLGERWGDRLEW